MEPQSCDVKIPWKILQCVEAMNKPFGIQGEVESRSDWTLAMREEGNEVKKLQSLPTRLGLVDGDSQVLDRDFLAMHPY